MDKINSKKVDERRIVQCNRCNFKWATIQVRPLCCAKCGSPYWDRKRIAEQNINNGGKKK